ncbi:MULTISPECIES: GNAT family N-acetyltransferase [Bacillus]|uniref:GNAT family N-acetyltransferase n=1 Tax=Bacillus TaxID=1386 RepID=UPI001D0D1420|nr:MULTISPECIES: GNAT family N-acetyltransferase [Bacillus]
MEKIAISVEQCIKIEENIKDLSELIINVVQHGASIGFLPPLVFFAAQDYWESIQDSNVILFLAKANERVVGSVQLHLCSKQNGSHRAEIAKLMTLSNYRRMGIGHLLMEKAHETAIQMGKTLIVLDTREGDPSNLLYTSLGYQYVGRIPDYAKSENGHFDATIIYYKKLT